MRVSGIAALVALTVSVSLPAYSQDWQPDPKVQISLDDGAANIQATLDAIEAKDGDILNSEDLATVTDLKSQLESMWYRHLEYDIDAITAAEDVADRILVNHRSGVEMSEFADRSAVNDALGFSYEDLSGWWSYPDMDYPNGCQDEDGQYRAALGRTSRADDGLLQFGSGELTFGMYDGGCSLANERVENGDIVLDATCSAEGENYDGLFTVEVLDDDEIKVTSPLLSKATRLKACGGTLSAALPTAPSVETQAPQSPTIASDSGLLVPYFAVYLVARECAKADVAFSPADMNNIDAAMKTISDASPMPRSEKESTWALMTGQMGSVRITEQECYATRQQMTYMFPPGTLIGSGEAFPF